MKFINLSKRADFFKSLFSKRREDCEGSSSSPYVNTHAPVKLGVWVLIVGFGGFLLWAGLAPLDEGVPCQGLVSIATKRKIVQHRQGGVVEKVFVQEGGLVREGQVLLSLDSQLAKARYEEVHHHYLGLLAAEARLIAEQQGTTAIRFSEHLLHDPDTTLVRQLMRSQRDLLVSRLDMLRLMQAQLDGIKGLVKEGYAPISQQRDLEIRIAQFHGEHANELAQVKSQVDADAEKSKALADEFEETQVRSPATGQVVGLQIQSVGAVVQPGQKIMDIVPLDEALLIEAKVAPHLIDKVHQGLVANIQFSSFANAPMLVAPGLVESVSADLLTEAPNGMQPAQPYFLARIKVTPEGMKKLGHHNMQPGMPVQAIIKTGERSLLTYIMHPLVKRMSASLKEE